MKTLAAIAVLVSLLTASPVSHEAVTTTTTTTTPPLVSPTDRAQWEKVAWCETHGNWQYEGPNADGGLGILRWNWVQYGGHEFAPAPHLATEDEQIVIAKRIQAANGYAGYVPDQNGECEGW